MSRALRTELAAERRDLIAQRKSIESRLAAVELLLSDGTTTPERAEPKARRRKALKHAPAAGLRESIRHALRELGYSKPSAVINALTESDYQFKGTTPLATRVYNELRRMVKDGLLQQDAQKRYGLKD